jgi:glycosyltransferase involved in cell wall biosynthesis
MSDSAPFKLSPLHRAWRWLPARQRRRMLTAAAAALAPRPQTDPPAPRAGLVLVGELSRASGLGEGARVVRRALQRLGVAWWEIDIGGGLPGLEPDLPAPDAASPPAGAPLLVFVNPPTLPVALLRLPRSLLRGRRIIGYWFWELPLAPPDWRLGTRFVHEVWAPSTFTGDAVAPLMPGRVRVVPLPLAAAVPEPSALDRAAFGLPDDAVVVLVSFNLASSMVRKNPLGAIAAFRAAFGDRRDRILLLKVGNPAHFPGDFAAIAAAADAPNIRLETRTLPTADLYALTAACDIVLSLHRSEGFGLVPAEAMLLGKPVIATGWSGNMTFMDADCAALVGYRLVPAEDPRQVYEGALWAEPDQADAVAHLRRLADDAAARAALGARGRAAAMARLGVEPLRDALRDLGLPG